MRDNPQKFNHQVRKRQQIALRRRYRIKANLADVIAAAHYGEARDD